MIRPPIPPAGAGETDPCKATLEILPLLLPHITFALTILAVSHGRSLVRLALSPGQGWYQWVLIGGVTSFFALLIWLWYRTVTALPRRDQSSTSERFPSVKRSAFQGWFLAPELSPTQRILRSGVFRHFPRLRIGGLLDVITLVPQPDLLHDPDRGAVRR